MIAFRTKYYSFEGVNPTFYEFLLAVDADTVVDPLALNRFVSAMTHDRKVIATCGETELANAKKSMISMMQVYEVRKRPLNHSNFKPFF